MGDGIGYVYDNWTCNRFFSVQNEIDVSGISVGVSAEIRTHLATADDLNVFNPKKRLCAMFIVCPEPVSGETDNYSGVNNTKTAEKETDLKQSRNEKKRKIRK